MYANVYLLIHIFKATIDQCAFVNVQLLFIDILESHNLVWSLSDHPAPALYFCIIIIIAAVFLMFPSDMTTIKVSQRPHFFIAIKVLLFPAVSESHDIKDMKPIKEEVLARYQDSRDPYCTFQQGRLCVYSLFLFKHSGKLSNEGRSIWCHTKEMRIEREIERKRYFFVSFLFC